LIRLLQNFRSTLPALMVGIAVICAPLLILFEPVEGEATAAIFPPGWSEADVMRAAARADLSIIRIGATSNIAIVRLPTIPAARALRQAGALILLPPNVLGGCLLAKADQDLFSRSTLMSGTST
jgi:hypothetical protein